MNSENQVAVLQQICPQPFQGLEPHLRSSYGGSHFGAGPATASRPALPSPFEQGHLSQGSDSSEDDCSQSASQYSEPQATADRQCSEASPALLDPLAAIQSAASSLGSSLAWWGAYITEFVADVAGDNDPSDEEVAEADKQKQAAKKASMQNQGSITGDLAQPLTRRHSRALSRGASLRLDGDWQISPKRTSSRPLMHENGMEHSADVDDDDETAKKDS
ncbi:hypothetical protein ABBQ32_013495 [Trebouxia sp. C0010 RCD-2024]